MVPQLWEVNLCFLPQALSPILREHKCQNFLGRVKVVKWRVKGEGGGG